MSGALTHWLRLLWGRAPALHFDAEVPFIARGAIHLEPQPSWWQQRAAAAHAAAHLAYSPARFDGAGLAPIARVLLALLEDARVEVLARRELPGLGRLWQPWMALGPTGEPDGLPGVEALLQRLALALADPSHADDHPWVRKGHGLFYLDRAHDVVALRTPAELRHAATRLGHDIGQMRLQFDARRYRPWPPYRDDHRWMWAADDVAVVAPPSPAEAAVDDAGPPPAGNAAVARHPEWDRLIARLRRDWCTVVETCSPDRRSGEPDAVAPPVERRLRDVVRALNRASVRPRPSAEGDVYDLDALVNWCVAQRLRLAPDGRVYRGPRGRGVRAAVWVLVDHSASTAVPHGRSERTVIQAASQSAAAMARALEAVGVACIVSGFHSNGRHAVRLHTVKPLRTAVDHGLLAHLQALRPRGSTRLGAVLRHAAAGLARIQAGSRWVLVLSDGRPHDIDVHDPRYLVEDARQAVLAGARRRVRMACVTLADRSDPDARRVFGPGGAHTVATLDALPQALQRLLA